MDTVLLWGGSQTGKTSLITATLMDPAARPSMVDYAACGRTIATRLSRNWQNLRLGRPVNPTADETLDLEIVSSSGRQVRVRDIRGGIVTGISDRELLDRIVPEGGSLLCLVEIIAEDIATQMQAIETILPAVERKATIGLVFTKCEMALEADSVCWDGQPGWWRRVPGLSAFDPVIRAFGEAVWPTSVYGYDRQTRYPAFVIGEFGELRPCGISPRGLSAPLDWAVSAASGS